MTRGGRKTRDRQVGSLYACSVVRGIKPINMRLAGHVNVTYLFDLAASTKTEESWFTFWEGQEISSPKLPDWL
jgi:hypothetical protein